MPDQFRASRRQVVQGIAVVGVAGPLLGSCAGDGGGGGEADGPSIRCGCHGSRFSIEDGSVLGGPAPEPLAAAAITVAGEDVTFDGEVLAQAAEIPIGGGTVFKDAKVVVTQPTEGTFQGFDATCTHQRCIVQEVQQ